MPDPGAAMPKMAILTVFQWEITIEQCRNMPKMPFSAYFGIVNAEIRHCQCRNPALLMPEYAQNAVFGIFYLDLCINQGKSPLGVP